MWFYLYFLLERNYIKCFSPNENIFINLSRCHYLEVFELYFSMAAELFLDGVLTHLKKLSLSQASVQYHKDSDRSGKHLQSTIPWALLLGKPRDSNGRC